MTPVQQTLPQTSEMSNSFPNSRHISPKSSGSGLSTPTVQVDIPNTSESNSARAITDDNIKPGGNGGTSSLKEITTEETHQSSQNTSVDALPESLQDTPVNSEKPTQSILQLRKLEQEALAEEMNRQQNIQQFQQQQQQQQLEQQLLHQQQLQQFMQQVNRNRMLAQLAQGNTERRQAHDIDSFRTQLETTLADAFNVGSNLLQPQTKETKNPSSQSPKKEPEAFTPDKDNVRDICKQTCDGEAMATCEQGCTKALLAMSPVEFFSTLQKSAEASKIKNTGPSTLTKKEVTSTNSTGSIESPKADPFPENTGNMVDKIQAKLAEQFRRVLEKSGYDNGAAYKTFVSPYTIQRLQPNKFSGFPGGQPATMQAGYGKNVLDISFAPPQADRRPEISSAFINEQSKQNDPLGNRYSPEQSHNPEITPHMSEFDSTAMHENIAHAGLHENIEQNGLLPEGNDMNFNNGPILPSRDHLHSPSIEQEFHEHEHDFYDRPSLSQRNDKFEDPREGARNKEQPQSMQREIEDDRMMMQTNEGSNQLPPGYRVEVVSGDHPFNKEETGVFPHQHQPLYVEKAFQKHRIVKNKNLKHHYKGNTKTDNFKDHQRKETLPGLQNEPILQRKTSLEKYLSTKRQNTKTSNRKHFEGTLDENYKSQKSTKQTSNQALNSDQSELSNSDESSMKKDEESRISDEAPDTEQDDDNDETIELDDQDKTEIIKQFRNLHALDNQNGYHVVYNKHPKRHARETNAKKASRRHNNTWPTTSGTRKTLPENRRRQQQQKSTRINNVSGNRSLSSDEQIKLKRLKDQLVGYRNYLHQFVGNSPNRNASDKQ